MTIRDKLAALADEHETLAANYRVIGMKLGIREFGAVSVAHLNLAHLLREMAGRTSSVVEEEETKTVKHKRTWTIISLILLPLLLLGGTISAQEVTVEPTAVVTPAPDDTPPVEQPPEGTEGSFNIEQTIAVLIVYLLYTGALAGSIQVAINQLKPLFLDPIKNSENVSPTAYLVIVYVTRTLVTAVAYLWLWGGIAATRAVLDLPIFGLVPDVGIAVVTIFFVVLGEEFIHPILDRFYVLRDIEKSLRDQQTRLPPSSAYLGS